MSSLRIGRLLLGPPMQWHEQLGDPVTTLGGAVVPNQRTAPQFQVGVATWAADGDTDTPTARLTLRRQLRSMLNNSPLKLAGLYLLYSDDPENSGWYVPDQSMLTDFSDPTGLATGLWQLASSNWYVAGKQRTHREARQIWMKNLTGGQYPRDVLGWVRSTDFATLQVSYGTLTVSVLPDATAAALTISGQVVPLTSLTAGLAGATLATGLADLDVVSFESSPSPTFADVIVYDRRGQITAPSSTAPDTDWEEVYGPDYPWNWQTSGQPNDCPLIANGFVRVRYDGTSAAGFRIDALVSGGWVEQGKMIVDRIGDSTNVCTAWMSAQVVEWTPDRAVIMAVVYAAGDSYSRERVYITVQRGWAAARFEVYPAPKAAGTIADAALVWCPVVGDDNVSVIKDDTNTGLGIPSSSQNTAASPCVIAATAGTGSALLPGGTLGASSFAGSENFVAMLRCTTGYTTVGPFQTTMTTVQAANSYASVANGTGAYGSATNEMVIASQNGAGYVQATVAFTPTQSSQVMEAEAIRNTGSSTTSQVTDSTASGGECVKDTQSWPPSKQTLSSTTFLLQGRYRCFARVKVDASTTGTLYWNLGSAAGSGHPVSTTSTSWIWVDLGELQPSGAGGAFSILAGHSAGTGSVYVDRVELYLIDDTTRTGAQHNASRDLAGAALWDSRTIAALVAR